MPPLRKLTVRGLKSIREVSDLDLTSLNVLIGGNGAGKSNLLSLFRLLRELVDERLQLHVAKGGGADAFLRLGRQQTPRLELGLTFDAHGYQATLTPTADNRLVFEDEHAWSLSEAGAVAVTSLLGRGQAESALRSATGPMAQQIRALLEGVRLFHFHDTGDTSPMKGLHAVNDNLYLRSDASNLAAYLLALRHTDVGSYTAIRDAVRLVMPAFDDFQLRPDAHDPRSTQLEWRERGSDYPFLAHQLSDGTLRFICLATVLLQPRPPATVIIDEPELGLHPYAINLLASMLRSASVRTQVIVATQSAALVDQVAPDDVVVAGRKNGASSFERLRADRLAAWLDDYSLGELWEKGVVGGGPSR